MFQQSSHPQQNDGPDVRFGVNLFYLLISGYATCFTVFLRRSFGGEAFGFNAVIAVFMILFYMLAHPTSGGMLDFFYLWWMALICQRIGYFLRRRRGMIVHSRFEGVSWFAVIFPFLNHEGLLRFLEIFTCVVLGGLLATHDQALGRFVFFGAFGLMIKGMIDGFVDRRQIQRMHDTAIEQHALMERWQSGRF